MIEYKQLNINESQKMTSVIEKLSDESNYYPFTSVDYGVDDERQKKFIEKMNNTQNCYLLGAYDLNHIAGIVYLYGGSKARTYHSTMLGIGVLEKYKSQGIGKTLIKNAINYAYECDVIGKINVQVVKENVRAINFYKKNGFLIEGIEKRGLFIDGEFFDLINMGFIVE